MAGLGYMSKVAARQRRVWHLVDARDQVRAIELAGGAAAVGGNKRAPRHG